MQWSGISSFEFDRKPMEIGTVTWSEFPNRGKAIVERLASEERNPDEQHLRVGIWLGKLTIRVRSFEIEKLKQSSPGLSFPP